MARQIRPAHKAEGEDSLFSPWFLFYIPSSLFLSFPQKRQTIPRRDSLFVFLCCRRGTNDAAAGFCTTLSTSPLYFAFLNLPVSIAFVFLFVCFVSPVRAVVRTSSRSNPGRPRELRDGFRGSQWEDFWRSERVPSPPWPTGPETQTRSPGVGSRNLRLHEQLRSSDLYYELLGR